MYDQKYIDIYSEKRLNDILSGRVDYIFDVTNKNSTDQKIYFAFQHYLIKSYLSGHNVERCKYYLKIMYNDFRRNPDLCCDSPLLSSDNIDKIFGNLPVKDQIKNYRDKYYSKEVARNIYNARKTRELTEEEKKQYYAYLTHGINVSDQSKSNLIQNEVQRILDKDVKELSDAELKFYCQYVSNFALKTSGQEHKTTVMIGTTDPDLRGFQNHDYIFINRDAITSIEMLTKTVCHETQHSVQRHAGFEQSQFELFIRYLNTDAYNSYEDNYMYSSIELDAERVGHYSASVFFSTFGRRDLAEAVRENRKNTTDERNYYSYMVDSNKKAMTVDSFVVTNMDKIIRDNPDELNRYPLLESIYNKDGSRKPLTSLMTARVNQDITERGLYDNYINYEVEHDELKNIPIDGKDSKAYLNALSSIYRDYALELKDYYHDTSNSHNTNQVLMTTNYKLKLSYKMLSYINDNYNELVNGLNGITFDHKNPMFDFIYDLRDFDINSIENSVIKNNPRIMENIKRVKEMSDNISQKFNHSYVDSKLNSLPQEIITSVITVPGVGNVAFADYFKNVIAPKMNGHKEVEINGQKYYVGDLIIGYSKYASEMFKSQNINTYESGRGK